uniref:Putative secreted peptide n=1 Tax=Rhipicephalus pulchellus TaxID=72859 RepID=L7M9Q8_RHIPC
MKISVALVVVQVGVLIVRMAEFALAPFVWAGNLAKHATYALVAYERSLRTKASAMTTGDRSFRATTAYGSQLERYEHYPAEAVHYGIVRSHPENIAVVTSAPISVHFENEVSGPSFFCSSCVLFDVC